MIHQLKILPDFFDAVNNGVKTCEIRQEDDRRFSVGDLLEWSQDQGYTGRSCSAAVTHIIRHDDFPKGVPEGYAVLSLTVVG
ncbi:DUF3850 domain-containing protein [Methanomassiliicoccaceae archaeon COG_1]|nr:DUF3850 domain-containing protein [Methanomassiliicoccaceae archaeon COG_1]